MACRASFAPLAGLPVLTVLAFLAGAYPGAALFRRERAVRSDPPAGDREGRSVSVRGRSLDATGLRALSGRPFLLVGLLCGTALSAAGAGAVGVAYCEPDLPYTGRALAFPLVGVFLGLATVAAGGVDFRTGRYVRAAARRTPGAVEPGPVVVEGVAEPAGGTVTAPFTGREVVGYTCEHRALGSGSDASRSVASEERCRPFRLVGEDGSVRVDPEGATLRFDPEAVVETGTGNGSGGPEDRRGDSDDRSTDPGNRREDSDDRSTDPGNRREDSGDWSKDRSGDHGDGDAGERTATVDPARDRSGRGDGSERGEDGRGPDATSDREPAGGLAGDRDGGGTVAGDEPLPARIDDWLWDRQRSRPPGPERFSEGVLRAGEEVRVVGEAVRDDGAVVLADSGEARFVVAAGADREGAALRPDHWKRGLRRAGAGVVTATTSYLGFLWTLELLPV